MMNTRTDRWVPSREIHLIVASHRRSGTHLLLEYVTRELDIQAGKTHDFPPRNVTRVPIVYIVRNPIETLWSTYRWFVHGTSGNKLIATRLRGLTFAEFLRGEGGPRAGFSALRAPDAEETLLQGRGMFYQPIRYWADHVDAYLELAPQVLIVQYERLVTEPLSQVQRIAEVLGCTPPDSIEVIGPDERVGWSPSAPTDRPAREWWDDASLALLQQEAGGVMARLGHELPVQRIEGI